MLHITLLLLLNITKLLSLDGENFPKNLLFMIFNAYLRRLLTSWVMILQMICFFSLVAKI